MIDLTNLEKDRLSNRQTVEEENKVKNEEVTKELPKKLETINFCVPDKDETGLEE